MRGKSLASHQLNNSLLRSSNDEVNSLLNQLSTKLTTLCDSPHLKGFCQRNDTSIVVAAIKCCVSPLPFFHVVNDFIPKCAKKSMHCFQNTVIHICKALLQKAASALDSNLLSYCEVMVKVVIKVSYNKKDLKGIV